MPSSSSSDPPREILWRPKFFVSRPDGSQSPLIAADELPPNLRPQGLPLTISMAETFNMMHVGIEERRPFTYTDEYRRYQRHHQTAGEISDHDDGVSGTPNNDLSAPETQPELNNYTSKARKSDKVLSWRKVDSQSTYQPTEQAQNKSGEDVQAAIDSIIQATSDPDKTESAGKRSVFDPILPTANNKNNNDAPGAKASRTTPCRYYASKGGCRNGDACRFSHNEHELSIEETSTPSRGWMDTYTTNPFFQPDDDGQSVIRPSYRVMKGRKSSLQRPPLPDKNEPQAFIQPAATTTATTTATDPPPVPMGTHPRNPDRASSYIKAPQAEPGPREEIHAGKNHSAEVEEVEAERRANIKW